MRVVFMPGAQAQLQNIRAYIARDNPEAARAVVARIEAVATFLGENPERAANFRGAGCSISDLLQGVWRNCADRPHSPRSAVPKSIPRTGLRVSTLKFRALLNAATCAFNAILLTRRISW